MRTSDRYLKFVLTIIAACLVWLSVKDLAFPSITAAQNTGGYSDKNPLPVKIVGPVLDLKGVPAVVVTTK